VHPLPIPGGSSTTQSQGTPPKIDETQIHAAPITAWLLVQIGALTLAALRVPLAAQYPPLGEFQAVGVLLAVQFAALALLFPWLLRNWRTTLVAVAAAWVMLACAAALAAWSFAEILPAAVFLTAWIGVFAILGRLRSAKLKGILSASTAVYVIGGPLLWYLQAEFESGSLRDPSPAFGPLLIGVTTPPHFPPSAWIEILCVAAAALLIWKTAPKR
jgi:hypothetical protein